MADSDDYHLATRAVRAGQHRTGESEHAEPIFLTSSFVFDTAEEAAARFSGEQPGNVYSRFTNPTVRTFEERLAAMEGGERCVATASGMSAVLSLCMGLLNAGDHIVASRSLFGTTVLLFSKHLARFGIETTFVSLTDEQQWEAAIQSNTKMLFLETPSNPLTDIADIPALAELAHRNDCWLAVDNCFCTPVLQRPFELGADLIVHSATKYLDGQGRCVGGAVIGDNTLVGEHVYGFLRTAGPSMSPFNAWVFLKGLETLPIRMKAHSHNALALAQWLETRPEVTKVYYAGLASHSQHELATRQQDDFGGLLAFDLAGGRESAFRFINATELVSITANLGDAKTTITHPASTTHGRLTPDEREDAGIGEGLIRISAGLEDVEDIKADLQRGFAALG